MIGNRWTRTRHLVPAALLALALSVSPAAAYVVNSTGLAGQQLGNASTCATGAMNAIGQQECTIFAALYLASRATGPVVIQFDIPEQDSGYDTANGWWEIVTGPNVVQYNVPSRTTIDGYTQPGASPNTLAIGDNAVIKIQLGFRLLLLGEDTTVRGLALSEVHLLGARRAVIAGNFIGTDPSGTAPAYAGIENRVGVQLGIWSTTSPAATDCRIGGPDSADRNVISGLKYGIYVDSRPVTNEVTFITIENNYIGLTAAGDAALPNVFSGIQDSGVSNTIRGNVISGNGACGIGSNQALRSLRVEGNLIGISADRTKPVGNGSGICMLGTGSSIGGVSSGKENVIAHNTGRGIEYGYGGLPIVIEILGNSIHDNGKMGIDTWPFDQPSWAMPFLTRVAADGIQPTIVEGTLDNHAPSTEYRIEVFASKQCDPNGYGEGEILLGWWKFTTDASGHADFSFSVAPQPSTHPILTATSTDTVRRTTSEFSACLDSGLAPRLDVAKSASPEPVAVGDVLTYDIVVSNPLPQDLVGVVFEDDLPSGIGFLSADADQGTCSLTFRRVTCDLGTISAHGVVAVEIRTTALVEGTIENVAKAGNTTSAPAVTHIVPVAPNATADFAIQLSASDRDLRPGDAVTLTARVANLGPDNAAARLRLALPAGLLPSPQGTPSATAGSYDPATGIWSVGILLPNASGALTESLTIPAVVAAFGAPNCMEAEATVSVATAGAIDGNPANDASKVRIGSGSCADIRVTTSLYDTCWARTFLGPALLEIRSRVHNDGPNVAAGVVVRSRAELSSFPGPPTWADFVACSTATPCTLGPGESIDGPGLVADCDTNDDALLDVEASSSAIEDPNSANNASSAGGSITPPTGFPCFIATAAYGSPFEAHVATLRDFRDRRLLTNGPGRIFVAAYYRLSPPIAAVISRHALLRGAVRAALTPMVVAIERPGAALLGAIVMVAALAGVLRARRRRKLGVATSGGSLARRSVLSLLLAASIVAGTDAASNAGSTTTRLPGASLSALASGSELVVLGEVLEAAPSPLGGATLRVRVDEFLKGSHPETEILVRAKKSDLGGGERTILFLNPALPASGGAAPRRAPGRFVLTKSGRYLVVPPDASVATLTALKRSILPPPARGMSPNVTRWAKPGLDPDRKKKKKRFSQVKGILKGDPDLRKDAMQVRKELLIRLGDPSTSFALDAPTIDTLRDLSERLAVEGTQELRDVLGLAMEALEASEGATLDPVQTEDVRKFLKKLPGQVFGG